MNMNSLLTSESWLKTASGQLKKAGILTARLDCLVLLEDTIQKDKSYLFAHPEMPIHGRTLKILDAQIERRSTHEPLAYIRGKSEFYGREFIVSSDTLEPRPETESMITLLHDLVQSRKTKVKNITIADIGTGSGCLAVTAKLEFPDAKVVATDISAACVKIAQQNAKKLGADITFCQGDLLKPLPSVLACSESAERAPHTLLLCNLPYVPDDYAINQAAMFEPRVAIFGGPDGLDLYRKLFEQITKMSVPPGMILTESLPFQHEALAQLAGKFGYVLQETKDLIQLYVCRTKK